MLHNFIKLSITAILTVLLSACATLDDLRQAEQKGNEFQQHLSKDYLRFAEYEASKHDWTDSRYFTKKGLAAAAGDDVQPEGFERWRHSDAHKTELAKAREELMEMLDGKNGRERFPTLAARAQANFDFWLDKMEEKQEADIKRYHTHYKEAMDELKAKLHKPAKKPAKRVKRKAGK